MTECEFEIIEGGKGVFLAIMGVTKTKVYPLPHVTQKKMEKIVL